MEFRIPGLPINSQELIPTSSRTSGIPLGEFSRTTGDRVPLHHAQGCGYDFKIGFQNGCLVHQRIPRRLTMVLQNHCVAAQRMECETPYYAKNTWSLRLRFIPKKFFFADGAPY